MGVPMRQMLVALLAIFVLDTSVVAADKIRIGFPDFVSQFSTLPLAQKKGFLQDEGLQAEVIRINATVGIAALASGEIDYYPGIGPGVAAVLQGVPIKVVACYLPSAPFALIARPELQSVQELRGKAVALNTFGGNIEVVARLIFKHFGLDGNEGMGSGLSIDLVSSLLLVFAPWHASPESSMTERSTM
jgi:ABC-type nitrate/sulfonate/bicarbonate transport system substrate-binding protein